MRNNAVPTYIISLRPKVEPLPKPPLKEEWREEIVVKDEVTKSALRLEHQRKISLTGDAQGATLFDGSDDSILRITVKRADRAEKDIYGNVISETYVTKKEMEGYLPEIMLATKADIDEMFEE